MPSAEEFRQICFDLLWQTHGGSGLNLNLNEIYEMTFDEIRWWHKERVRAFERMNDALAGKNELE